MGWSWTKVSVVAIALALGGCCDHDDVQAEPRLYCNLAPTAGVTVTVKGTAQYTLELNGYVEVKGISYSDGQKMVYVPNPEPPSFSVTVDLEVGDLFQSSTDGYIKEPGSILAEDTFTPADGSAITKNSQLCWDGLVP